MSMTGKWMVAFATLFYQGQNHSVGHLDLELVSTILTVFSRAACRFWNY